MGINFSEDEEKKSAVVIGYGRFGALLCDVLGDSYDFSVIETDEVRAGEASRNYSIVSLDDVGKYEFVFLAVPIDSFEDVVKKISPLLQKEQVIVDICSVKVFPARVMEKYIGESDIIATHPLFGPDSASLGLEGLKVAFAPIRCSDDNANHLRYAWERHFVNVIDTTPEAHDQDTAYSQAFTYSVARIILNMNLPKIDFDTRSYQAITRVAELSANDTEQLFHDMMHYNPYFPKMLKELEASWLDTLATLETIRDEPKPDVFSSDIA